MDLGNFFDKVGKSIAIKFLISFVLAIPSIFILLSILPYWLEILPFRLDYYQLLNFLWVALPIVVFIIAIIFWAFNRKLLTKLFVGMLILQFLLNLAILLPLISVTSIDGAPICNSNDPTKIVLKSSWLKAKTTINSSDFATIVLTNMTEGDLTNIQCAGTGAFATVIPNCPKETILAGSNFGLNPKQSQVGKYSYSKIELTYIHSTEGQKSATITCSGPITIS